MTFAETLHEHMTGAPGTPDTAEQLAADAVAAWLARARPDLRATPDAATVDPDAQNADVRYGCLLLGARWVSRKQTPVGAAPGYDGAGADIRSVDPDVQRLVGVGRSRKPEGVG